VRTRWAVIGGNEEFFDVTKRIHNFLHGESGDGEELGARESRIYQETLRSNAEQLGRLVEPNDVVVLHDPQTAGLTKPLLDRGSHVIWNCHVGVDAPNDLARGAWDFLRDFVSAADMSVFSRRTYVWEGLDSDKVAIIPPCIDAFSPKNQDMDGGTVAAVLRVAGILDEGVKGEPTFLRRDRSQGLVANHAEMIEEGPVPPKTPIVLQVSRWDRLKDPIGVLRGYADHVRAELGAHLLLAGPSPSSVADDPEGAEVLEEVKKVWGDLADESRERIHLVCLPMDDLQENAAILNALQRRADVIVQKSLAEGFGLTVAEGMWKERPVVGSAVGGIRDQIEHGKSGLLIEDPEDLAELGAAVTSLLEDRETAARMGKEARKRVLDEYLPPKYLIRYLDVIERVADGPRQDTSSSGNRALCPNS
jgi:trehalose synthase